MRKLIFGLLCGGASLFGIGCSESDVSPEQQPADAQMSLEVTPASRISGYRAWTNLLDTDGKVVAVMELDFHAKLAALTAPGAIDMSFDLAALGADQLPATVATADQLAVSAYQAVQRSGDVSRGTSTAGNGAEPIGKNTSAIKWGWRCEWCGDEPLYYRCMTCGFCGNYECWYIDIESVDP